MQIAETKKAVWRKWRREMYKVLIVDDEKIEREGIRFLLSMKPRFLIRATNLTGSEW